jgi:hypothetical protein
MRDRILWHIAAVGVEDAWALPIAAAIARELVAIGFAASGRNQDWIAVLITAACARSGIRPGASFKGIGHTAAPYEMSARTT